MPSQSRKERVRSVGSWVALALLGLVLAAAVSLAASRLSSQPIGLSAEPLTAGQGLAPADDGGKRQPSSGSHRSSDGHRSNQGSRSQTPRQTTAPTPAPPPGTSQAPAAGQPPATTQAPRDDSSRADSSGGRGQGGGDD